MNQSDITIKRALISVSDKQGIVEFSRQLHELNIEILSTGGTSKLLREANIPVRDVSEVTQFPEMMDGRIKTLHPKIHGGILGLRDKHEASAKEHDIHWIDLVVVNLYPFAATIQNPSATFDDAVENIDIGGPAMIRSAAKNMGWVGVVVDSEDYKTVIAELIEKKGLSFTMRKKLAKKAFETTAQYDFLIHEYLSKDNISHFAPKNIFSETIELTLSKSMDLRYGENPHQAACAYQFSKTDGILNAKQHQGKALSYNNIVDADAAYACAREFTEPTCVIVKHANPCGVATSDTIFQAYKSAFDADAQSAFGGIVALNRVCTKEVAEAITKIFFEVLIAPGYEPEALAILTEKSNLRVLELGLNHANSSANSHEMKFIDGGVLLQEKDVKHLSAENLKVVTKRKPTTEEMQSMLFAWPVLKHIKSNAILIAKNKITKGVGAGQVSRIDSVEIAIRKAGSELAGSILASDAFFPFRDSIDRLSNSKIGAIIQPGGSIRDEEVIAACDEYDIAMVFTGLRCFKH